MNVKEQEKRLENIFREKNNEGFAVAITGCWGVGKTHFWKSFLEKQLSEERLNRNEKIFNRKYAYVSLFGIESLSDLKTQIYSNIENTHSSIEVPKWLKGLPSIFKDTRISQLGISAPAKLIDTLMFSQVKDAIICFDDFERMSKKLDIKDVMGLANQLKLERKCQVILILDESKNNEDNEKKYAEYKEKLIDETIKITSVEPLIREKAKDIDEPLVDLMVAFADGLEIHNFRFFQKVIKLYKQFIEQLPNEVADSTKEVILIRILQGYLIQEHSYLEYTWADSKYFTEKNREDWSEIKKSTYETLKRISRLFTKSDLWVDLFINEFEQLMMFDSERIKYIANSDLIKEQNILIQSEFRQLYNEFWNCKADHTFAKRFFDSSIKNIGLENLGNLDFAITILENLGAIDESKKLEQKVKEWIAQQLEHDRKAFRGINAFGQGAHRFGDFIDDYFKENPLIGLPSVIDSINAYLIVEQWSEGHELVINRMNKEDLKQFVEIDYFQDERFSNIPVMALVEKFPQNLKTLFKEILEEKKVLSKFHRNYCDFLIARIDK